MSRSIRLLTALAFSASAIPAVAQSRIDCPAVVETTIAELSAGYPDWNGRMEALARTAAGSACVKAAVNSMAAAPAADPVTETVRATGDEPGASLASAETADGGGETAETAQQSQATQEEEAWHPFKDLKFNEVSARPGKKPYERRRESIDD